MNILVGENVVAIHVNTSVNFVEMIDCENQQTYSMRMMCVLLRIYGDPETHTKFIVPVWYSCGKHIHCARQDKNTTYINRNVYKI